ncbi:hypothetical protein GOODEAATRI_018591, partial [Goodea atripinnis]
LRSALLQSVSFRQSRGWHRSISILSSSSSRATSPASADARLSQGKKSDSNIQGIKLSSTMGPFQEYEEKKSPEKGSPRSRIPRLVLHRFRPKDKGSPLSDSLLSEEDGKECDISSEHSKRTISTNSFCSGSEADFSSSSSTGSLKTKEILTSSLVGKKASSR